MATPCSRWSLELTLSERPAQNRPIEGSRRGQMRLLPFFAFGNSIQLVSFKLALGSWVCINWQDNCFRLKATIDSHLCE
jgi:hypothetical protein